MNYLDIAISVPLLYGLIKGFSNGLIKEITGLLSLVLGVYVAVNFSILLEPHLSGIFNNYEQFKPIIAFAILFVATIFIIKLIGILANNLTKALALGFISKIVGSIFGGLKVALILSFLLTIESRFELIPEKTKESAQLYTPTKNVIEIITPHFKEHQNIFEKIQDKAKETSDKIKENFRTE